MKVVETSFVIELIETSFQIKFNDSFKILVPFLTKKDLKGVLYNINNLQNDGFVVFEERRVKLTQLSITSIVEICFPQNKEIITVHEKYKEVKLWKMAAIKRLNKELALYFQNPPQDLTQEIGRVLTNLTNNFFTNDTILKQQVGEICKVMRKQREINTKYAKQVKRLINFYYSEDQLRQLEINKIDVEYLTFFDSISITIKAERIGYLIGKQAKEFDKLRDYLQSKCDKPLLFHLSDGNAFSVPRK